MIDMTSAEGVILFLLLSVLLGAAFGWWIACQRILSANKAVKSLRCPLCGINPEVADKPHKYVATRNGNDIVVLCGECRQTFVAKVDRPSSKGD